MIENQESYKQVLQLYGKKDSRYVYCDINLESKGINYQVFTKLRFESINKNHISEIYTINGWYLMWFLMSNAILNKYIEISLQQITNCIKLTDKNIRETLTYLIKNNIIYCSENPMNINKYNLLHIVLAYNDNDLYKEYINPNAENGFDPIPTDFVKTIIESLSPTAWAIYSILCTNFNYFYASTFVDKITGEIKYSYTENCYSFPTQEKIYELLHITKKTFRKYLDELINSSFYLISEQSNSGQIVHYSDNKNNQHRVKGRNNIYVVNLYRRIEYVYYCIMLMEDIRDDKIKNKIKKKGFEDIVFSDEQNILWTRDYIDFKFGGIMKMYKEWLDNNNIEKYKELRKEYKICP